MFGANSGGGMFGNSGGGLFGAQSSPFGNTGGGMFGAQPNSGGGLFGSGGFGFGQTGTQGVQNQAPNSGLFGGFGQSQASGGMFGQPSGGLFGQSSSGGLFGQPTSGSGLFGQPTQSGMFGGGGGFGGTATGTTTKMQEIVDQETKLKYAHIGIMDCYKNKSFEELGPQILSGNAGENYFSKSFTPHNHNVQLFLGFVWRTTKPIVCKQAKAGYMFSCRS